MRSALFTFGVTAAIFSGAIAARAAEGEAFTSADKAGPDFAVQGEYQGEFLHDGKSIKIGLQVVALGDGKFDAVAHEGGLPGDGWKRGDKRIRATGSAQGGAVSFTCEENRGTAKLVDGKIVGFDSGGQELGKLSKVERKSPTLGAKPPAGAIVLFDGSGVDHFPGAKMTEDKLLMAGTLGKDEFQDFTLHLEFRTPFMPKARGQGRGNSGVYLQNRYELQVLDSFGLEGENNECGGIYSIAKPIVNMCLPPLSWQTYDIDFAGARFEGDKKTKNAKTTIKHNGVVVFDGEFPNLTPGGADNEKPGKGPLQLQQHGNPVVYRNIWVVEKK